MPGVGSLGRPALRGLQPWHGGQLASYNSPDTPQPPSRGASVRACRFASARQAYGQQRKKEPKKESSYIRLFNNSRQLYSFFLSLQAHFFGTIYLWSSTNNNKINPVDNFRISVDIWWISLCITFLFFES